MASIASKALRKNRQSPRNTGYAPDTDKNDSARWRRNKVKQAMRDGIIEALPLFRNDDDDWW